MKKWTVWIALLALIPALAGCDGGRSPIKGNGNSTENPELSDGGGDVADGGAAQYFFLPAIHWADVSQVGLAFDHYLEKFDAVTRDATWDDVLMFTGGEKAMADHLLWDGLDWDGTVWLGEDGTPDAVRLYARGLVFQFSLEVVAGRRLPFCIVLDEDYKPSRWNGEEILAVKSGNSDVVNTINGLELREMREIEFSSNGVDYKLTLYTNTVNAGRGDELCARFVRYAMSGGFHLYALSDEPIYEENMPNENGGLPDRGLPPEDVPAANILRPGDPGYIEPFPAPDGVPGAGSGAEDFYCDCPDCINGTVHLHPHDPSV